MDDTRVADYFLVVGRPEVDPVPVDELNNESIIKASHKLDPIVDLAVINRSFGEICPSKFKCIEFTPTGFPADLNHGSIRAPEMYLCYRRGRDKPPLVDIGVLYDGKDLKERVLDGCEVIYNTVQGRSANVNNSGNTRIYVTFRRASPTAACDTLAVTDICVILLNKGEMAPHAYHMINKTLNKGMMGSDVYLCYKKSMTKTNVLAYKPVVLSRYPKEDLVGLPLPERVAMFCLPLGATLECWPDDTQQPRPIFSTFILTAASGDKVYGAAVTFYEFQDEDKLDEAQRRQLGLVSRSKVDTPCVAGEETAAVTLTSSATTTVHQNKCICLLSSQPFFGTFKKFLGFLYKMSLSGRHSLPLERFIAHFLSEVPFPSPQRPRILIQLPTTAIMLSQPDETPLPKSGASFIELLKNLGPTNCITVLLVTLMEQKLLIHSLRPAVLTSVAEAIANIIFPFHWQCPYIPLCPLVLSYVLNSPTPFIVGIDSRYFDLYDPPSDVTCIDLDTNTLTISEDRRGQTLKMMPKKPMKVLKSTLEKLYELLCQNPGFSGTNSKEWLEVEDGQLETDFSGWKKEMQMETSIQEAFLRFMAVLLKGYNNFLLPIIKAPTIVTTDISNLFDIQGFLKSRDRAYHKFYSAMMKTQAFSRFIEERSFVSDKDTCLAFFDECVEKVDDNSHDVRLIDFEDSLQSERTVFVLPPEPTGLPEGAEYSYNGFPLLDESLFPVVAPPAVAPVVSALKSASGEANLSFLCSPMTRRTKHELKSAQKIAMRHSNIPKMWAHCLVWHCFSLWFIHLPAYIKTIHSKTKALRIAYEVLSKAQSERLQPPDEVCYRVMMQLCGLYHQPVMAVKVLFEMKRNGVQPNAVTYGFYNKAVLESKWPTADTRGYQLWTRLRHVIMAVAQFKRSWHLRRQSVYSISESDLDGQSLDSFLDSEPAGATIIKDLKARNQGKRSRTGSETGPGHQSTVGSDERASTGGLSDRGYGSSTFEESKRISLVLGSQNSLDLSSQLTSSANERTPTESDPSSTPPKDTPDGDVRANQTSPDFTRVDSRSSDRMPDAMTSSSSCDTVASSSVDFNSTASAIESTDQNNSPCVVNGVSAPSETSVVSATGDCDTTLTGGEQTEGGRETGLMSVEDIDAEVEGNESAVISSPSHGYLVPVTENDPLGVFMSASADDATDAAVVSKEESKPDDFIVSEYSKFSDDKPFGLNRKPTSVEEVVSNSLNGVVPTAEDQVAASDPVQTVVPSKKSKSSIRGEMFGSVMRSAATKLFSKYNDLKKSISTQGSKTESGSRDSLDDLDGEPGSSDATVTAQEVGDAERFDCDENADIAAGDNDSGDMTPLKNRLRVPSLYAPLATMWGGLKTLQTKEAFQGLASSLEQMTASVRGSLIESWNYSMELKDEEIQRTLGLESKEMGSDDGDSRCSGPDELAAGGHNDLDQLVPIEESSDRGSVLGDQSSFRFSSGSMLSLPQSSAPVEVEMCTLSKCQACGNLLYDEEIMAGWTSDDSNLSTSCQFCGVGLVPFIHIYIRDYRQSMRSPLSNLSQSVESMLSVQSAPVAANRKTRIDPTTTSDGAVDRQLPLRMEESDNSGRLFTAALKTMPETLAENDDRAECGVDNLTPTDNTDGIANDAENAESEASTKVLLSDAKISENFRDLEDKLEDREDEIVKTDSEIGNCQTTDFDVGIAENNTKCNEPVKCCVDDERPTAAAGNPGLRWRSKDLESGLSCPTANIQPRIDSGSLENRRCTSECSLNRLNSEKDVRSKSLHHRRTKEAVVTEKTLADAAANVSSNGSDDKGLGVSARKYVELDPITVPYLSPLVLRKELENVLDQDGDLCLNQPEFVDQHPIIYWNLIWYFKRLDVPSHMLGFILTAKSLNKNVPSTGSVWTSADSRHVAVTCMWDSVRLHHDHGPPMYILWNQANGAPATTSGEVSEMFSRNTMFMILNFIKGNDVISPLRMILKERSKRRMQTSKTRFHSIYRDLLFLSFTALGRENIDHEAFDREFKSMFLELPPHDSARLRNADRTPNSTAIWCRKMFHELHLPAS